MSIPAFFSIRNWEKFQHYTHRNPPWIRLYRNILHQREYQKLSDTERSHLTGLFILAAEYENNIPNDPEWLQHELCTSSPINLDVLARYGWITFASNSRASHSKHASNTLASCKQSASPDTDTDTDTDTFAGHARELAARNGRNGAGSPGKAEQIR